MLDGNWLTLFLYIAARVSGFILFSPIFGRKNVPGIVQGGIITVISAFIISITKQSVMVPQSFLVFSVHILMEMTLGFLMGMVVNFFFAIPQVAGHMIDTQMGMTMNQIYDAGSQSNQSVTSIFLNLLMMLLFFAANGHHTLFRILITSGEGIPYGGLSVEIEALTRAMLAVFTECFVLAIKLSLPILAAELLGQLGMGVLMKVIPQINVFSINIELKVVIGLTLLYLLIAPFSEFLLETENLMLKRMEELVGLMAP